MRHQGFTRTTLLALAVLLLCAGPAKAGDFEFEMDPGKFGGMFVDVDTDSAKFEEYSDHSSGFNISLLELLGRDSAWERVFSFRATNVRRDDARYTMDYRVEGKYGISVDYNKIPHNFGNNAPILHARTGDGTYEIADPIQQGLQDAIEGQYNSGGDVDYDFLKGLLDPYLMVADEVNIGLRRDRTHAAIDLFKLGKMAWGLELTHENREGTRQFAGSFGFGSFVELPEPIDYDSSGVKIFGEWNAKTYGLQFGYEHQQFENNISTLYWDNPFRATDSTDSSAYSSPGSRSVGGAARGFADLAPDNDSDALFLNGRAKFGERVFWTTSLTYTVFNQDDPLLPYTLNTSINPDNQVEGHEVPFDTSDPANRPATHADAEAKILHFTTDVTTRIADAGRLVFRYRMYDYANDTTRIVIPGYVRFHAVWEGVPRITVPYEYSKQDVGLELSWRLGRANTLGFSFNRETWDRTFREIEDSDEDVFKLWFDSRAVDWMMLRASVEKGSRSIGSYHTEAQFDSFVHEEEINNQPGLRKIDEADRDYDAIGLSAQFTPADAVALSFGVSTQNDDYDESELGLQSDEILQYNAEFSYTPDPHLNFFAFLHRADREVVQYGRQSGAELSFNPEDSWFLTLDEVNDTWGLGFGSQFAERWSTHLSATWSRADGEVDAFTPPGGSPETAVGYDNYEDIELFMASAKLGCAFTDQAKLVVGYHYEDYTTDSFIVDGLQTYLPGSLLLNAENGDYTAHVVSAYLKIHF